MYICIQTTIMVSERRKNFERVAAKRVDKILEAMRLLGNCSNRNNYDYEQEDVDVMFAAIKSGMKQAQNRFESELNRGNKEHFKF